MLPAQSNPAKEAAVTIGGIHENDVVRCNVRGDRFWARATGEAEDGTLPIVSLNGRPIPTLRVRARQVVGHWRMRKGSAV
jgi:hypothetical protein